MKKYVYVFTWGGGFGGGVSRLIYDDTFAGAMVQMDEYFKKTGDSSVVFSVDATVQSITRYDNPDYPG